MMVFNILSFLMSLNKLAFNYILLMHIFVFQRCVHTNTCYTLRLLYSLTIQINVCYFLHYITFLQIVEFVATLWNTEVVTSFSGFLKAPKRNLWTYVSASSGYRLDLQACITLHLCKIPRKYSLAGEVGSHASPVTKFQHDFSFPRTSNQKI